MPFVRGGLTEMDGARAGNTVAAMLRTRQGKLSAVSLLMASARLGYFRWCARPASPSRTIWL